MQRALTADSGHFTNYLRPGPAPLGPEFLKMVSLSPHQSLSPLSCGSDKAFYKQTLLGLT